jgi:hypothetical protein
MTVEQKTAATFLISELRRARMARGLSQEDLGKAISYSGSLVSAVELGQQRPSEDLLTRVDKALNTGGLFGRMLVDLVSLDRAQPWLRGWRIIEGEASTLCWYEPLHVPGPFQTEAYARAVFESGALLDQPEVERRVAERMERHGVLDRESPPRILTILDEGLLRRCVGGPDVMREQLLHLARVGEEHRRIRLHVVPLSAGEYPALGGPFIIATLSCGEHVVYVDTLRGQELGRADDVLAIQRIWEATLGEALTPRQSIELIREVAETWS